MVPDHSPSYNKPSRETFNTSQEFVSPFSHLHHDLPVSDGDCGLVQLYSREIPIERDYVEDHRESREPL